MKLNLDGSECVISDADEGRENPAVAGKNPVPASPATRTWAFNDHDQLGKFLAGLPVNANPRQPGVEDHPCAALSKGDKSAAMDAAMEFRKQRES